MATCSYLTATGAFNRVAIMKVAWASARIDVTRNEAAKRDKWWMPLTLRKALASALRRIWDLARGYRACAVHRAAAEAEDARRAALPVREMKILNLRDARALAPMIDSTVRMVAEIATIDARLSDLGVAA